MNCKNIKLSKGQSSVARADTLNDCYHWSLLGTAFWSLIIWGSNEKKKKKWHHNYSHLMILAIWVCFAMLVLPTAPDPWQCPKAYRQDRVIQVPWKWPSAKQEQLPVGSKSPQKCSNAGGHGLHKEGVCATCHMAREVMGHVKGSCQTRLPPQVTSRWCHGRPALPNMSLQE